MFILNTFYSKRSSLVSRLSECCSLPTAAIYWLFEGSAHEGEHDGLREAVSASMDQRESLITSAPSVTGAVVCILSLRLRSNSHLDFTQRSANDNTGN